MIYYYCENDYFLEEKRYFLVIKINERRFQLQLNLAYSLVKSNK